MNQPAAEPLSTADSNRLIEFARACKAAARVVSLYPGGHPAIATTLGRIVQLTSAEQLPAPLKISVLADGLLLGGRPLPRPDASIGELAALLHDHLIGELTVHAGGDADAWRTFLLLLGRTSESVRSEGGISRLWTITANRHIELKEIDYARVLQERRKGLSASWEQVIASCLQGSTPILSDEMVRELLEAAGDSGQLNDLISALDARGSEDGQGLGSRAAALIRLLQAVVEAVKQADAAQVDPVMRGLAAAVGRLSPDMMISLLAARSGGGVASGGVAGSDGAPDQSAIVDAVVDRMSDSAIAGFVARNATVPDSSIERVAQAFQTLVKDTDQRERLLALAHDEAMSSPLGSTEGFEEVWDQVAQKMLTSYSDKPYVSDAYARELGAASGQRSQAIDVDHVHDDPPERLVSWMGTVATTELRALDLTLVLDLLRIEDRHERWSALMRPVEELIDDLLLVGDIDAASALVDVLVREAKEAQSLERRQTALIAIDVLVAGSFMENVVNHLSTLSESQFERVKTMCLAIGEVLIRPLAEALSKEDRTRPRERLTAILITFGAVGRREVERLKNSPNAAVRRTAIYLLREFGGSEALPELTELLNDRETHVQREAVRAILNIGTDVAFDILREAIMKGSAASRDAIMHSISTIRDERAAPIFEHILEHVDPRGEMASLYLRSVEALGALKTASAVPALKTALYRGEWWAPGRTAPIRNAAAAALALIGTPEAQEILDDAAKSGPRRVRSAVRTHAQRRSGSAR